jgi:hypothetical protein
VFIEVKNLLTRGVRVKGEARGEDEVGRQGEIREEKVGRAEGKEREDSWE